MNEIIIGITDCSKYSNYENWILSSHEKVSVIKLSEKQNNREDVKKCSGILFTGGEDVYPEFYRKPDYLKFCYKDDINQKRDEFELSLMEYTEINKIPVLGIRRGLQLFNVFKGGTLIPDLPSWSFPSHSKIEGQDRYHQVHILEHSKLANIIGVSSGEINSAHHQAADLIGEGLQIAAKSEEGVIEALERDKDSNAGFLCLVQWHPERMLNQQSNFVYKIRETFINYAKAYK